MLEHLPSMHAAKFDFQSHIKTKLLAMISSGSQVSRSLAYNYLRGGDTGAGMT